MTRPRNILLSLALAYIVLLVVMGWKTEGEREVES